jgi:hypothetical protein
VDDCYGILEQFTLYRHNSWKDRQKASNTSTTQKTLAADFMRYFTSHKGSTIVDAMGDENPRTEKRREEK